MLILNFVEYLTPRNRRGKGRTVAAYSDVSVPLSGVHGDIDIGMTKNLT